MDVISMTRELGKVIQQDERYISYKAAKEANEGDDELNKLICELNLVQMAYKNEEEKDEPDKEKLTGYDTQFRDIYAKLMVNTNMQNFEIARREIDSLMNYVMKLLSMCVNGADPATCEPEEEDEHEGGCSGDCGSCSGCE